jgi:hypothetical protein
MLSDMKHSSLSLKKGKFHRERFYNSEACGLYYKPITIANDDSGVVNKLETSLTENARVIIYDRNMFIVQATGKEL